MSRNNQPSMFQSLLDKRKRVEPDKEDSVAATIEEPEVEVDKDPPTVAQLEAPISESPKRKPGRPRGRRSNPDYTQISAYVPIDLYLDIQDELAKEKRRQRKRTALTVSELSENLLREWLKQRKSD
jgi:hypothetical protein